MADAYRQQTACALSANTVTRSAFGFGFPLVRYKTHLMTNRKFATQMYDKLNPRWASSLLGFISVAMLPIPFLLYKYGAWLRSKAKFAFG